MSFSFLRSYCRTVRARFLFTPIVVLSSCLVTLVSNGLMADDVSESRQVGPVVGILSDHQPQLNELGPIINWPSLLKEPKQSSPSRSILVPFAAPQEELEQQMSGSETVEKAIQPDEQTASPELAKIVILIDDLGYNRKGMEGALALPKEVALAILPSTPFADKTAETSKQQGRLIMLHAPMETEHNFKLGPGGLYANMGEQELKDSLQRDIESLPGIQGVNNHMGSLLTAQPDAMKWVMETLKPRSLFFVDSLTSANSVAGKTAKEIGLKTARRDIFLDNSRSEKAIDKQFTRLVKLAHKKGAALAIGHPYPETMAYLKKRLAALDEDKVTLVPLTDILE